MSQGPIAIVTALPEEMGPLALRLDGGRRRSSGEGRRLHGRLAGRDVVLVVAGDGPAAARRGAAAVLEGCAPALLLGLGVAGGLSPELRRGALLAAAEVMAPDGGRLAAAPDWLRRALEVGGVTEGLLTSVDRVVDNADAKRALWGRLGEPAATAVDLESAAWSAAAAARRVPWLIVRAISDEAEETLPLPFARLASGGGGVSRGRVLARLALQPQRVPAVLALRRRVAELAARLATFAEELLA